MKAIIFLSCCQKTNLPSFFNVFFSALPSTAAIYFQFHSFSPPPVILQAGMQTQSVTPLRQLDDTTVCDPSLLRAGRDGLKVRWKPRDSGWGSVVTQEKLEKKFVHPEVLFYFLYLSSKVQLAGGGQRGEVCFKDTSTLMLNLTHYLSLEQLMCLFNVKPDDDSALLQLVSWPNQIIPLPRLCLHDLKTSRRVHLLLCADVTAMHRCCRTAQMLQNHADVAKSCKRADNLARQRCESMHRCRRRAGLLQKRAEVTGTRSPVIPKGIKRITRWLNEWLYCSCLDCSYQRLLGIFLHSSLNTKK